jgi:lysozyme
MTAALDLLVAMLKRFEGCRLVAYRDVGGIWTIGYGETAGVTEGMVWTQEQAESCLRARAAAFLANVLVTCPNLVDQPHRAAACASLAYNIGTRAFYASSVRLNTARGQYARAAECFVLWNKVKGRVVAGLTRRRLAEKMTYLTP